MTPLQHSVRVIDVDSHVYEPPALWDDYVPPKQQALCRSAFWHGVDSSGSRVTILNGSAAPALNRSALVRQAVWRPGMTSDEIGRLDPTRAHALTPGASDPVARIEDLEALGVAEQIVYPTLFAEHFPLVAKPDAAAALAAAYNDWVHDFCSVDPARLHPVAVLPLQRVDLALEELDRVADKGFGAALLRPMFYAGAAGENTMPFIDDPHFNEIWARMDALGVVACVHPALGTTNPEGTSEGSFLERVAANLDIGHSVAEAVAYLQDASIFLTAVCFHGLLEDLPALRLALAHSGATMLPLALEKAETYLWVSHPVGGLASPTRPVSLEPREVFERHPVVVSFDGWERSVAEMTDEIFLSKAAWGSRYPNHDASTPAETIALLEACGNDLHAVECLMSANAAALFNLHSGHKI